jgi:type IV secretory pathway protease TraF
MASAVALMAFASSKPAPVLVWSASESAPIGLYHVQPAGTLFVTTLTVVMPTRTVCGLSRSRRLPTARCSTPQNASLHCLASRYVETSSLSALAELSSARHASVTDAAARSPSGRAAESSPMAKSFS